MNFPDFSYSPSMQIILVFITAISSFFQLYFVINTMLKLYNHTVRLRQKVLYVFLLAVVCYCGWIYGIYAFTGFQSFSYVGTILITIPNPLFCVLGYLFALKLLNFSSYKSISTVRQTYIFWVLSNVLCLLIKHVFFRQTVPYNYLLDGISLIFFVLFYFIIYHISSYFMNRYRFLFSLSDSTPVHSRESDLLSSFVQICLVFVTTCYMLTSFNATVFGYSMTSLFLALSLWVDFSTLHRRILRNQLDNKNVYLGSLANTVSSFNNLKDNFGSILQNYGEYLEQGDLPSLKQYHESLLGKTVLTVDKLYLTQKMPQNPTLVSLLLKKLDYAQQQGVTLRIPVLCSLQHMHIEDFDLCRVLGNLLDNAIEAASLSQQKRISFSVEQKNVNCKLIILSNSTRDAVDTDSIIIHGETSKEGHMGVGLTQVRNTLRKYGNSTLQLSYYENQFSVYIELWTPEYTA